ncbi:MAG: DNA polymerase III subunit gamma/tau C-terminal domain-containing protein, partial [Gammaproteobacteria bacterium]
SVISNESISSNIWQDIIDEMALAGLVKELAGHCDLKEHTSKNVHLSLSPDQEHLCNPAQKERLHAALKTRFGDGIKLLITVEDPAAETPAQRKKREDQEKQLAAEKSVREDPVVKAMQDVFDATLDKNSIRSNTS